MIRLPDELFVIATDKPLALRRQLWMRGPVHIKGYLYILQPDLVPFFDQRLRVLIKIIPRLVGCQIRDR